MSGKLLWTVFAVSACALFLLACSGGQSGAKKTDSASGTTRAVALTSTIRIPVLLLENGFPESALADKREALAVIAGGPDELPQGPTGFELTTDGRILVSDPVRRRVAVFDATGGFRGEWPVGFPVESIALSANGIFRLRPSDSSPDRFYDSQGHEQGVETSIPETQPLIARLSSPTLGVVEGRPSGGPLQIAFESGTLRLISVDALGAAPNGGVYVALEVTPGGDTIAVQKQVRKYGADGKVQAEVTDIPLNYDFAPVDELKVRRGVLYQLEPAKSEIKINRWNLD